MTKQLKNFLKGVTVALAVVAMGSHAEAGWGHFGGGSSGGSSGGWGSSGGDYVSYGSSGGSSGGWGSSGGGARHHRHGGLLRRLFAHKHHHRAKWGGSSGGWGSSGGSSGGYTAYYGGSSGGSSGGYTSYYGSSGGSSGGWGSSGGSSGGYYSAPVAPVVPADPGVSPGDVPPPPREGEMGPEASIRPDSTSAVLAVRVPADARILVNGHVTSTPGAYRQYISRGLERGQKYSYEVTAEIEVNGEKVAKTETVQLTAGNVVTVNFDFTSPVVAVPAETTLTLHVPADAKLFLAGREMKATGTVRQFSTTKLTGDNQWMSYPVRVVANVDGREVVKEQTISLKAGEAREIEISFDNDAIAQTALK